MSPLRQVLQVFEDASQPLSLAQIARKLDLETGVVEDMIAFWVRKGKLCDMSQCADDCTACSSAAGGCPFVMKMPKRYGLVEEQ